MPTTQHYIIHANWCPHCVTLINTIDNMKEAEKINEDMRKIGGSNVQLIEQEDLEKPYVKNILGGYKITGFPTILSIKNDKIEEYNGLRDETSLLKHFKEKDIVGGSKYKTKKIKNKNKNKTAHKPRREKKNKTNTKKRRKTKRKGLFTFLF